MGRFRLEVLEVRLFGLQQRLAKGQVLIPVHRAVDVVSVALVVAAGAEGDPQIDRFALHDRAGGIEEVALPAAGEGAQLLRQGIGGEGPGG